MPARKTLLRFRRRACFPHLSARRSHFPAIVLIARRIPGVTATARPIVTPVDHTFPSSRKITSPVAVAYQGAAIGALDVREVLECARLAAALDWRSECN
jgi:hypothetical protein